MFMQLGATSTKPFLSTPSARRATHALFLRVKAPEISIHALREEGDLEPVFDICDGLRFLSTPSARRATPLANPNPAV